MSIKPIQYDLENAREYSVVRRGLKAPSSNWSDIRCPFCKTITRAYHWSLAGGGKKCIGCGAKHFYFGTTAQVIK